MSEVELLKNRLKTLGENAPAAVVAATKKRLAELESEPITLAEAFGLPAARWVDPDVTRAVLTVAARYPDLWPWTLYRDGQPVTFDNEQELRAATG